MTAKKRAKWWIVSTHVLTAGFAMPVLACVFGVVLVTILKLPELPARIILLGLMIAGVIGGTYYSVRYVRKSAVTEDWEGCTRPSVVAFLLLHAPLLGFNLIRDDASLPEVLLSVAVFSVLLVAFAKITGVEFRRQQAAIRLSQIGR